MNKTKPTALQWPLHVVLFALSVLSEVAHAEATSNLEDLRQLTQLAEYIGADYAEAVSDGQVINAGEYQEMVEFSDLIVLKSRLITVSASKNKSIATQAQVLQTAVQNKQNAESVRAVASEIRRALLDIAPQSSLPRVLLSKADTTLLFEENCTGCHGLSGQGNGPLAANMNPAPTDFTDKDRALNRSVMGLYDVIQGGIEGASMPSFNHLTDQQRWSLAFHVGSLAFQGSQMAPSQKPATISLQRVVESSPTVLAGEFPLVPINEIEWLRAHPQQLFTEKANPLAITRERLEKAFNAHRLKNYSKAQNLAVSAYLDGFELIENNLDARDVSLRKEIESGLMRLRHLLSQRDNNGDLDVVMTRTLQQLEQAQQLLTETSLSSTTLFTASFIILLREGLEALLVVIALATVLIRTDRRDALVYMHIGWISALMAGLATWAAAEYLITISGASREVMEGFAALLAAIVLFYVGFWMHSKSQANEWHEYIQQNINARLKTGTLWGIALMAFIAVYREVFETVLFYQSLLTQTIASQYSFVAGGFLGGVVLLSIIAWLMVRFSVKLPIARFFSATTYLLLALSFILMGKAISALQEAAFVSISPLPVEIEIEWVGIYSTWQGILAQSLILLLFIALTLGQRLMPHKQAQTSLLDSRDVQ